MAAKKGKLFLLKAGDGEATETFTTVAGLRSTGLTINGESVDVTDKDSSGNRELLDGGGITSMSISGSGVFKDDTSQVGVEAKCVAKSLDNYQIVFDGGRSYEGAFQVTSVEYAGEYNGEHTYSLSLESSGSVTITAST